MTGYLCENIIILPAAKQVYSLFTPELNRTDDHLTGWDFDPGRGTNDQSGDIAGFSVVRVSVQSRIAQPHSTIILCWLRSNKKIVQRPSGLIKYMLQNWSSFDIIILSAANQVSFVSRLRGSSIGRAPD